MTKGQGKRRKEKTYAGRRDDREKPNGRNETRKGRRKEKRKEEKENEGNEGCCCVVDVVKSRMKNDEEGR